MTIANEALARALDNVARRYLLDRYSGPGNPLGTLVLRSGNAVATKVPAAPQNPLMNAARGVEHPDELVAVLDFYGIAPASAGTRTGGPVCWLETSPYTPRAVTDALVAAGFRMERQAATLYAAPILTTGCAAQSPSAVRIRDVTTAELELFLDTLNRGFGVAASALPAVRANQSFWCAVDNWHFFLATIDAVAVGAAVLAVYDDATYGRVGYLAAASTLEQARGRGAQRALIAARMARAIEQGCTLITGQAAWGTTSSANMQRAGLQISHLRTVWTNGATG